MSADLLSPRETEVFVLMLHGYGQPDGARRLNIARGTWKTHCKNISEKLAFKPDADRRPRAKVFEWAEKNGFISYPTKTWAH